MTIPLNLVASNICKYVCMCNGVCLLRIAASWVCGTGRQLVCCADMQWLLSISSNRRITNILFVYIDG